MAIGTPAPELHYRRASVKRNKGHRRGKHNNAERSIEGPLRRIEGIAEVARVLPGRREACRHRFRPGTLRVRGEVPAGMRLSAYTDRGVRTVIVVTDDSAAKEAVIQFCEEAS